MPFQLQQICMYSWYACTVVHTLVCHAVSSVRIKAVLGKYLSTVLKYILKYLSKYKYQALLSTYYLSTSVWVNLLKNLFLVKLQNSLKTINK